MNDRIMPKKRRTKKKAVKLVHQNKKNPKVIQHADYLSLLHRTKNTKKRRQLIGLADRDQLDAISEIIDNVLRGTLVLNSIQREKLRRHKTCLRLLSKKSTALQKKKLYLQKHSGGFLPILLKSAIPIIAGLFSSLVGGK